MTHYRNFQRISVLTKEIKRLEQLFPISLSFIDFLYAFRRKPHLFTSDIASDFGYIMSSIHVRL